MDAGLVPIWLPPRRMQRLHRLNGPLKVSSNLELVGCSEMSARHLQSASDRCSPNPLVPVSMPLTWTTLERRLLAAAITHLDWRTFRVAEGAIDTAVAGERFQHRSASRAVIKILASVRRHRVGGLMSAMRTGQRGGRFKIIAHLRFNHCSNSPS